VAHRSLDTGAARLMRLLYFDCIAGISGDMALGALVDAGADAEGIRTALAPLPLDPFSVEFDEVDAGGIRATRAVVRSGSARVIRTYASIRALLDQAALRDDARALAQRIFSRLARAEAAVHGRPLEQVTFHEIGAVDSIVDIVGAAVAITMLGVDRIFCSAVPTGMGMTRTEHGALPIPAPAVVELLRGAPLYSKATPAELTTPTGAAILATVAEGFGGMPPMTIDAVGYGAGSRQLDFPNVLRVFVGAGAGAVPVDADASSREVVLETNVDDATPEVMSHVVERLLEAGARDAWLTPIIMKKGRPAVAISALCASERESELRDILFREAGTLGVRAEAVHKHALPRSIIHVETPHGRVRVKVGTLDGRPVTIAPEYEDCARLARETGAAVRAIQADAVAAAQRALDEAEGGSERYRSGTGPRPQRGGERAGARGRPS
jgi:pyridinium-3,5-bisthiocarboxylic acid mononucleotide nickel chelatase